MLSKISVFEEFFENNIIEKIKVIPPKNNAILNSKNILIIPRIKNIPPTNKPNTVIIFNDFRLFFTIAKIARPPSNGKNGRRLYIPRKRFAKQKLYV
ncbi:MAG: hypothetical protein J6A99_02750 [Clostridia bacterium]|nr:hypothetical protein [Clostridia bacterium]